MDEFPAEGQIPRGARGLLMDRDFGSFFIARLLASIGVWLHSVVAAIAAYDATGSATAVGLISAVQFAPQLLLAPLSGSWADRGNVKRQMMCGRVLCAVGSFALGLWFLFAGAVDGWTSAAVIGATSLVAGVGLVVGGPAMQSSVPQLVSREELPAAMALNTAPITIGRVVGPAVGALTSAGFGYAPAFFSAGVSCLLFVLLTSSIRFPKVVGRTDSDTHSMRDALAFVRVDRPTLIILIGVTALGFGSEPTVTLAPPLAAELDGGARLVGALTTSMGLGAATGVVVMSILSRRLRQEFTGCLGIVIMALSLGTCALDVSIEVALAAFASTGLAFIMSVSSLSTLVQLRVPATMRGRIMALWLMGFVGSRPLGAMLVGTLADHSSLAVAFATIATVLVACAVMCRPRNLRGRGAGSLTVPSDDSNLDRDGVSGSR